MKLSERFINAINEDSIISGKNAHAIEDAINFIRKYEDAEEQRRLLMLPCKVGDVIWWKNGHHIVDCYVIEVQISARRSEVIFKFGPQLDLKAGARFEDFGKTVFLTRAEAKAALKGAQNDG